MEELEMQVSTQNASRDTETKFLPFTRGGWPSLPTAVKPPLNTSQSESYLEDDLTPSSMRLTDLLFYI